MEERSLIGTMRDILSRIRCGVCDRGRGVISLAVVQDMPGVEVVEAEFFSDVSSELVDTAFEVAFEGA